MSDEEFQDRFAAVLRERRTIGTFRPEKPADELIRTALELACWAPNHRKTEPWRFTLLGPRTVQQIVALNSELTAQKKGPAEAEKKQKQWSAIPGWLLVTCVRCEDSFQAEDFAGLLLRRFKT
ncbi:MAG: nitroreductase family protein [Planctomycetaceae bacterium]